MSIKTPNSERHTVIPAVFVMLKRDEEILLIRRYQTGWHDGEFTCPSGHLDGGESLKAAAIREAKEEVDVTIEAKDLELVYVTNRPSEEGDSERVGFFFIAHTWAGEPRNAEPHKCDFIDWYSLEALPDKLVPPVQLALEGTRDGQNYTEIGF